MLLWKDTKPFLGAEEKIVNPALEGLWPEGQCGEAARSPVLCGGSDKSQH